MSVNSPQRVKVSIMVLLNFIFNKKHALNGAGKHTNSPPLFRVLNYKLFCSFTLTSKEMQYLHFVLSTNKQLKTCLSTNEN